MKRPSIASPCHRCGGAGCPRCNDSGFWLKGKAVPLTELTASQANLHHLRKP
jgi:hypothetical protein